LAKFEIRRTGSFIKSEPLGFTPISWFAASRTGQIEIGPAPGYFLGDGFTAAF
jgi:hypothetical protein